MRLFNLFGKNFFKKDMFAVLSKRTPYFLEGAEDPNKNSVSDTIQILSNYPAGNSIPNLFLVKIMRIPAFLFSVAFFTCIGWASMDQHDSLMSIFRFVKISSSFNVSFNYREIPIWSFGTFIGLFIAIVYNIFVYQRISRHLVESFKKEYFIFLSNALFKVVNDNDEKSVAIFSIRNSSASTIFIENKDGQIFPTVVNIGTIHHEDEDDKVFQEYYPLKDNDEYRLQLKNEYNKTYKTIVLRREGNKLSANDLDGNFVASFILEGEKILVEACIDYEEKVLEENNVSHEQKTLVK